MASTRGDRNEGTQHILSRLGQIEQKVDSLGRTHAFALRVDKERVLQEVENIFKDSQRKAQVYLAANGQRAVNEIASHLGMKRQNVGPLLKGLMEEDLLELFPASGRDIWHKTPVDRTVGITKYLMKRYSLGRDGKSVKKA